MGMIKKKFRRIYNWRGKRIMGVRRYILQMNSIRFCFLGKKAII